MKKCDYINCSNEAIRSITIAPGTTISVCDKCDLSDNNSPTKTDNTYIAILIDGKKLPIQCPDYFDNAFVLQWDNANILIPWKKGDSARKAILQWAINQIVPDTKDD